MSSGNKTCFSSSIMLAIENDLIRDSFVFPHVIIPIRQTENFVLVYGIQFLLGGVCPECVVVVLVNGRGMMWIAWYFYTKVETWCDLYFRFERVTHVFHLVRKSHHFAHNFEFFLILEVLLFNVFNNWRWVLQQGCLK